MARRRVVEFTIYLSNGDYRCFIDDEAEAAKKAWERSVECGWARVFVKSENNLVEYEFYRKHIVFVQAVYEEIEDSEEQP